MKTKTKQITLYAMEFAIIFAARTLDHALTGWLTINAAVITLAAAFTCAFVRPGWKNGLIAGTMFGLSSLLTTLIFGGGATIYGMLNPCVSVIPRMITGAAATAAYLLVRLILRRAKPQTAYLIAVAVGSAAGAAVNTVTVLTSIWLFKIVAGMEAVLVPFVINSVTEIIASAIITPFIAAGVRRGLKITEKSDDAETAKVDDAQNSDEQNAEKREEVE